MSPPPREVLAAEARRLIEMHDDDWDSLHAFVTLHWDGQQVSPGTWMAIDPAIHPTRYPLLMLQAAHEQLGKDGADPPYAYALQIESFGAMQPGPDAPAAERARFEADRKGRTIHLRPDAVESAVAWVADIHGRLWCAAKIRGRDGISETFYAPGRAPGGQLINGLLAVARATATAGFGLPPQRRGETWN